RADQHQQLAVADREVEPVDGPGAVGVHLGHVLEEDLGHARSPGTTWPPGAPHVSHRSGPMRRIRHRTGTVTQGASLRTSPSHSSAYLAGSAGYVLGAGGRSGSRERSFAFSTFPMVLRGSASITSTRLGTLKPASRDRAAARTLASSRTCPGRATTTATTTSPRSASGTPTTALSRTPSTSSRTSSTSFG